MNVKDSGHQESVDESWPRKMAQTVCKGLGFITSKFGLDRGQGPKEVDVAQFRMMFSSDLYPETSSVKEAKTGSISDDGSNDDDDDDDDDNEGDSKRKGKISEAGQRTEKFLLAAANLIIDHVISAFDPKEKIVGRDWPDEGREAGHCGSEVNLKLSDETESLEEILLDLKGILSKCFKTGHPRVMNSSTSGLDVISLAGEWLTATANTNMFTYEIAPVFILIEDLVLTKMRSLIGWPEACGDGIFAPGGAISNMYALAVARHKLLPECKTKGMWNCPRLVMFVSAQCNPSLIRSAVVLGIGLKNVILIDSNARGQMLASDLDAKIRRSRSEGAEPFFVSTNCGSTVLGSFDALSEIADVCERHKLWMHVDASHGGNALFSSDHCHLVRGIRRAHSVTWNCHSMMGVMLQCSAILIREKGLLEACNSACASYLFQRDKHYDVAYDTGDKAIQCGRHNDVFKLWLVWRARGDQGMARHVERLFHLARCFTELLASTEGFLLVLPEFEFVTVCFWYVPEAMRKDEERDDVKEVLSQLVRSVAERVNGEGNCLIGWFDPSKRDMGRSRGKSADDGRRLKIPDLTLLSLHDPGLPAFFKVTLNNPSTDVEDLRAVLEEIRRIGEATMMMMMMTAVAGDTSG